MFRWDKNRLCLNISARQVLRLERSLSDNQVSLPGFEPQQATAYLCVFHVRGGLRVAIVLHLHQASRLAFYLNSDGPLDKDEASRVLGEAVHFAETLGFMLGNLDYARLTEAERESLWAALPLKEGASVGTSAAGPNRAEKSAPEEVAAEPSRPAWTVEEMKLKRNRFIENLGRLLGML